MLVSIDRGSAHSLDISGKNLEFLLNRTAWRSVYLA